MEKRKTKFLRGITAPLLLAFVGLLIAAVSVALAFSINYVPENKSAYIVFAVCSFGVLIGFSGILWGLYSFFASPRSKNDKEGL